MGKRQVYWWKQTDLITIIRSKEGVILRWHFQYILLNDTRRELSSRWEDGWLGELWTAFILGGIQAKAAAQWELGHRARARNGRSGLPRTRPLRLGVAPRAGRSLAQTGRKPESARGFLLSRGKASGGPFGGSTAVLGKRVSSGVNSITDQAHQIQ